MSKRKPPMGGAQNTTIINTQPVTAAVTQSTAVANADPIAQTDGVQDQLDTIVSSDAAAGLAAVAEELTIDSPAPAIPEVTPVLPVLTEEQKKNDLACDRIDTLFDAYAELMNVQKIVLSAEDQRRGALILGQIVDTALDNGTNVAFGHLRSLIGKHQEGLLSERYALRGTQQLTPSARNRTTTCYTIIRQRVLGMDMTKINWHVIAGHLYPRNPERAAAFKEWLLDRTGA